MSIDYKQAGVDIEEGYLAVSKYKDLAEKTKNSAVLNNLGSFAGMYSLGKYFSQMKEPVLVSGTDGVGTKLDIAFKMKKYDTIGIDCVAMCVNDIICHGARPLFFLDYLACGKLNAEVAAGIVEGIAAACRETGCVLLGGETAEMPGFYDVGKYDVAGFAVGIVDKEQIIDGINIHEGDALIGIASSGPHSNGYSLIRKVLPNLDEIFDDKPIGETLLTPTRLYVKPVLKLMEKINIHGMANITGGGFFENIPRMFSSPFDAVIKENSWPIPEIFYRIAHACSSGGGKASDVQVNTSIEKGKKLFTENTDLQKQLFNTFNMGIGFVMAISPRDEQTVIKQLNDVGFPAFKIGRVEKSQSKKGIVRFVKD
jgi:phosphoribosylformylglycinamidine cyclo-ligase